MKKIVWLLIFACSVAIAGSIEPDAVLYFSFDKINAGTVSDESNNGNDGKITNAKEVDGKFGKALEFNGKDSWVEIAANKTLDIQDEITMAAWIFKTEFMDNNNGETIISKKQGGAYCLEVHGWNNRSPRKLSTENRINGSYHPIFSEDDLPLNKWIHTAATYDGKMVKLYQDGNEVKNKNAPGKIDVNAANLYIGAESDGLKPDASHGRFSGIIDEAYVIKRALTQAEIRALMDAGAAVEAKNRLTTTWAEIRSR